MGRLNVPDGGPAGAGNPIDGLLGALGQTFSLIALGYAMGALGVVDTSAGQGYNAFLSWVALPAILFSSMATLDFGGVDWMVLLVILLAKCVVMLVAMVITYIFSPATDPCGKPENRLLRSAMFGLFTTLTNDVGVGLPIVEALFPKYVVYLLFPMQSLIFNPVSLVLLEYSQGLPGFEPPSPSVIALPRRSIDVSAVAPASPTRPSLTVRILKSVFANQLVWCVLLGLLYNVLSHGHLPLGVQRLLSNAGNAFSALAAFNIGLSMVGKSGKLKGRRLTWPFVLASLKVVASGIITQKMAALLAPHDSDLQEFAFVYGALPVATVCCVFAGTYDVCPTVIAGGLVLSMIFSPIAIFIGLGFILVREAHDLDEHYGTTALYLDVASILGSLWLIGLRVWCPGFRKWPLTLMCHFAISSCLFAALHLSCILLGRSCIDLQQYTCSDDQLLAYQAVMYARFFVNLQLQCWPVLMALNLVAWSRWSEVEARSLYYQLLLAGWLFPAAWTLLAWCLKGDHPAHFDLGCIFAHGVTESVLMAIAYLALLGLGGAALVLLRARKLPDNFSSPDVSEVVELRQRRSSEAPKVHDKFRTLLLLSVDLLGLLLSTVRLIEGIVSPNHTKLFQEPAGIGLVTSVLAVVLVNSLGLVGCLAFAFHKEARALYSSGILSVQGFFSTLFTNPRDVAIYFSEPSLEALETLGPSTVDDLVAQLLGDPLLGNRRHRLRWYVGCATGFEIVTWLVERDWVPNREQAVALGQQLVRVGVVYHIHLEADFEDSGQFYRVRPRP